MNATATTLHLHNRMLPAMHVDARRYELRWKRKVFLRWLSLPHGFRVDYFSRVPTAEVNQRIFQAHRLPDGAIAFGSPWSAFALQARVDDVEGREAPPKRNSAGDCHNTHEIRT